MTSEDREALAGLAGACCFDCGVESQQVGLSGDGADEFDDVANLLCSIRKCCDLAVGSVRLGHGDTDDLGRLGELTADLIDRPAQLVGCDRCRLDVRRRLIRSGHCAIGALRRLSRVAEQGRGGRMHRPCAFADRLKVVLDALPENGDRLFDDGAALLLLLHRHAFALCCRC